MPSLERLEVWGNVITMVSDDTFDDLSNLTHLDLQINNLVSVPCVAFTPLSNLQDLRLSRNPLTRIPPKCFSSLKSLEVLHLKNMELTYLGKDTFFGLERLEMMALGWNNIHSIDDKAFGWHPNLQSISLNYNNLSAVPRSVWGNLSTLADLDLTFNPMRTLNSDTFVPLKTIARLRLANAGLSRIHDDAFRGLDEIVELRLENNELQTLPDTLCGLISNSVMLTGNPWSCDCRLQGLKACGTGGFNERIRCESPPTLKNTKLADVPVGDLVLQCQSPSVRVASSHLMVGEGDRVELDCDASGFPEPELQWLRLTEGQGLVVGERGTFDLPAFSRNDSGVYICTASNYVGKDFVIVYLSVSHAEAPPADSTRNNTNSRMTTPQPFTTKTSHNSSRTSYLTGRPRTGNTGDADSKSADISLQLTPRSRELTPRGESLTPKNGRPADTSCGAGDPGYKILQAVVTTAVTCILGTMILCGVSSWLLKWCRRKQGRARSLQVKLTSFVPRRNERPSPKELHRLPMSHLELSSRHTHSTMDLLAPSLSGPPRRGMALTNVAFPTHRV
ncbi:LINGO2 [Branchiostoma lanceolatum]|uniref:LINGO2 protein n=2 Tax=Branchiostoma lanceolatum TaxID=7740 RepID=A0A8J9W502_BRALA|nr:LINGO2 [Branchiostoma lanceolatum]